jgi:hypothetical protein
MIDGIGPRALDLEILYHKHLFRKFRLGENSSERDDLKMMQWE